MEPLKLILRCYRIKDYEIENNPNLTGEYNVPRYVNIFNKRIEPLLVVFKSEVRDTLIVKDPKDRQFFTAKQCELISGIPRKEGDQDELEDVLTLSEEEEVFWNKIGSHPNSFLEDLGILEAV